MEERRKEGSHLPQLIGGGEYLQLLQQKTTERSLLHAKAFGYNRGYGLTVPGWATLGRGEGGLCIGTI